MDVLLGNQLAQSGQSKVTSEDHKPRRLIHHVTRDDGRMETKQQ